MQLITARIKRDSNIFLISDEHEGATLFDSDGWDTMVEMLNSPYEGCSNNYWIDHSDMIEGRQPDHRFFDMEATAEMRVVKQADMAIERRKPIARKGVAILMGNHEFGLQKSGDWAKHIADGCGVPYGTYSCKITYRDDQTDQIFFKHYATHGYGTMNHQAGDEEQRLANMKVKLKRMLRFKASDCYLMSMGHTHRLLVRPPLLKLHMVDDGNKIKQVYDKPPANYKQGDILHEDMRWYVNTGCFLKTLGLGISSYSERLGYDPNVLGFAVALVRGGRLVNVREEKI